MPQLDDLIAKAQTKQSQKTFSRGNRPDRIASGQINLPSGISESEVAQKKAEQSPAQDSEQNKKLFKVTHPDKFVGGESRAGEGVQLTASSQQPSVLHSEQLDSTSTAEGQPLNSERGFKKVVIRQQLDSKSTAERQLENPLDSNWTPNKTAGRQQLDSKSTAERQPLNSETWSVDALSGKEAELVKLLFNRCKNAGSRQTEKLSSHILSESLRVSTGRLRNLVERLAAKNILSVSSSKRGNGSWRQFTLPGAVYQEMTLNHIDSKSTAERQQLDSDWTADWTATKTAERSSSSSSLLDLNTKKTTTSESFATLSGSATLPPEWTEIDVSPLENFRFTETHLKQLANRRVITPEQVQDSIYAFAFDLEQNGKGKSLKSPLNYFMAILSKGPYAPPENYENPADRQRRLYLEAKEKQRQKRKETEENIETLEFEEWVEKLTLEQRSDLVPPKDFAKPGSTAHNYQLREYFRENIWPALKERSKGEAP
jgi:hypothetical protein